jgi:hypothetical protein
MLIDNKNYHYNLLTAYVMYAILKSKLDVSNYGAYIAYRNDGMQIADHVFLFLPLGVSFN